MSEREAQMDDIDCAILAELQANARIPFAELGRRVGLSTPAAIERVRRLEEREVIVGYRTLVDPAKVGLPVRAFVKVTVAGDKLAKFSSLVRTPVSYTHLDVYKRQIEKECR